MASYWQSMKHIEGLGGKFLNKYLISSKLMAYKRLKERTENVFVIKFSLNYCRDWELDYFCTLVEFLSIIISLSWTFT